MGRHKKKSKLPSIPKVTSGGAKQTLVSSPKVHPALDDCYPLNKLCRLCLLSNTNMEPIFTYTGDIALSQRIFQCTSLEIHENEEKGLPTSICGQCKRQLDQCYEFRTLCCKNNEVLHNLNLILSPKKAKPAVPSMMSAVPIVQIEKLPINPSLLLPPRKTVPKRVTSSKNYGEIPLNQLFTPSKRGHKATKMLNRYTRELAICLTPMSAALVNKYKKKDPKTKTKAAVKAYAPPQAGKSPRVQKQPAKSPLKLTPEKVAKQKSPKPVATKRTKAKPAEIAVPPKKRKQNFQPAPEPKVVTISCTLCAQTFNNLKNLSRHTAAHENNRKQNRVFNCDICQKEYLKASQLTEHLRSVEHVQNAASHVPEEADVSILPDEQSILPDTNGQQDNISTTVASPTAEQQQEQEEQREQSIDREADKSQPSPEPELVANASAEESAADETIHSERAVYNLSPISIESGSPKSADVQCDSTNNEENLLGEDSFITARHVSFADVTEILD